MASALALRRKGANAVFVAFCAVMTFLALGLLVMILYSLLKNGLGGLDSKVFTMTTPPPGEAGGLINAITGSLIMCAIGMVAAIVIGIPAGTWLAEYGGDSLYAKVVRFLNDVLLSAPSILIGLFVYEIMVKPLHGFSAIAGGAALALVAVPVITRATEDVLKLQPSSLRESGVALGTPLSTTIRNIIWRAASSGIATAGLLAFARISGETAPLLFTSLGDQFQNWNLMKPTAALPQVIYQFAMSPYDDWRRLAWVGAILVTGAVLATQIIARIIIREPDRQ
ncbi:MAG TPA: phosphate ABC transporter permease PstA [Caulobacteraceae bacterium]